VTDGYFTVSSVIERHITSPLLDPNLIQAKQQKSTSGANAARNPRAKICILKKGKFLVAQRERGEALHFSGPGRMLTESGQDLAPAGAARAAAAPLGAHVVCVLALALPGRPHAAVPRGLARHPAAQAPGKWRRGGVPGVASRSRRRRRREGRRRRRGGGLVLVPLGRCVLRLCHGDVCRSEHAVLPGSMAAACGHHRDTLPPLHLHVQRSSWVASLQLGTFACCANSFLFPPPGASFLRSLALEQRTADTN
jgi:hypothetical protein